MALRDVFAIMFIVVFFAVAFFLGFAYRMRSAREQRHDTLDDRILDVLDKNSIAPFDLALELQVDREDVLSALTRLERRGIVQRCPETWQDAADVDTVCWTRATEWHKETLEQ